MDKDKLNYTDLSFAAQQVWGQRNIDMKRAIFINQVVNNFKFVDKREQFKLLAEATNSGNKLDKLAADLVLLQTGDRVIK